VELRERGGLIIIKPRATFSKDTRITNRPKMLKKAWIKSIRSWAFIWMHRIHGYHKFMYLERGS